MIDRIRSSGGALSVLALGLISQIPHAQYVFFSAGHDKSWLGWFLALVFAIALESAVLVFVVRGWHIASYVFATSSVLINFGYYGMLPDVFTKLLVSVTLPLAIACYSHLLTSGSVLSVPTGHVKGVKGVMQTVKKLIVKKKGAEVESVKASTSITSANPLVDGVKTCEDVSIAKEAGDEEERIVKYVKDNYGAEERVNISEVSRAVGVSRPTVTKYVKAMRG